MNEQSNVTPIISVRGLTKSFGKNTVLHGIDLDISNGEKITFNCAPSDTWQAGERKK